MTADANVNNIDPPAEASNEPSVAHPAAEPVSADRPTGPKWSMPKSPVTRKHADEAGRIALEAVGAIARSVAGAARYGARIARKLWRRLEVVPSAVKLFSGAVLLMLLGIVGAIALDNTLGLMCTVVVVPVCAGILGALGHRWYSGLDTESARRTDARAAEPTDADLQRSAQYVDRKLSLALTSFGTEHHQQAVIALLQAKTAVELTLGTEQDLTSYGDLTLRADDYGLRPQIRAGSGSTSAPREGNSLAS
ncbi:MAG: hypothetical protein U1D00_34840 [Mycobacterium sp.]|nr:hypothetical protein [Mycobacterium sp.]